MTENSNLNSEYSNTDGGEIFSPPSEEKKTEVKPNYTVYIPYGFTPEAYKEYTEIKRAAKITGIAFLAMTGIIVLLSVVISALLSFSVNFGSNIYLFLQNSAVQQVEQIIFSLTAFVFVFVVVFKLFGIRISDTVKFGKPKKEIFLPFFLFAIGFCAFANIATSYAAGFFESFGIEYSVSYGENPDGIFGFLLTVISTVLVPALAEEFACRGLVLGILKKFGEAFAVITSAVLFGLMHGNFEQMPFAFLVGLVLGFVTVKSGTLWIAIAVHAFNNLISVLFDYLPSGISQNSQNIIYIIFLCISMIFGIVGLMLLKNRDVNIYDFKTADNMHCKEKEKYKWFFRSIPIIILAVICFVEAFSFFVI